MNDLVDRIATGRATLLSVEDICTRLGVHRSTFDRWVKNGEGKGTPRAGKNAAAITEGVNALHAMLGTTGESSMSFPPPDIRIGNSPKWELETFKTWLRANAKAGG
ncbi:helix-turn-helix transcriptional regulator [Cupriavidus sp. CuC1]|uniref:helix-turn-helix transcriptional regulator n=1 Tax=Cupriavidus sp. CuC1 TaxID=3373131 RepID=UPI0037D31390